jgi:SagB-type dehydrogenase family enzyme
MLANDGEGFVWEVFHENSKISMSGRHPVYGSHPSDAMVVAMMRRLRTVKPYADRPKVPLPPLDRPADGRPFAELAHRRASARGFASGPIGLDALIRALDAAFLVTRDNADNDFPRPFRSVPSGGALYPLEVYLHAARVEGLTAGLYHLDPEDRSLDVLRVGDESARIAPCMVQRDLFGAAAATMFLSAVFFRSVFKYGDRGYRFVLLEAGHAAQNLLLSAEDTEIGAVPIGGFLDRSLDRYLGLDGINESVVYAIHLGSKAPGNGDGSVERESTVDGQHVYAQRSPGPG